MLSLGGFVWVVNAGNRIEGVRKMKYKIKNGVTLHVVPTEKYKTIRVLIRFSVPATVELINKRTLLSSVLETTSQAYPTQKEMSEYLASLYGTSFGISVGRKGDSHYLSVILNTVNDKYLKESEDVLGASIDFLKEVLFNPHLTNDVFDQVTFKREQKNLVEYIHSVYDDKQSLAALRLQEMFFANSASQGIPSFGTAEGISQITAQELTTYYNEMLVTDNVDVFVLGDVDEDRVTEMVSSLPFTDRPEIISEGFYHEPTKDQVLTRVDSLSVTQGKLNLGYQMQAYYYEADYFALLVFNGLFGGFAHSKLFMNVREKESMAYYASSSIDTFRGYLTVQTGIDPENKERVQALVEEQLIALENGEVSSLELAQTKEMLKNQYITAQDNPGSVIEAAYIQSKFPKSAISENEWLKNVDNITVEDVQRVAASLDLQAVYFMKGASDNGENA